ncbi:MAG TPA: hypothetical protein VL284_09025 [Thermoanaerobaculia bacterium]|nr:hypothetical protein [Thermoanaerobaculia bacterium]
MKKCLILTAAVLFATGVFAQNTPELNPASENGHTHHYPAFGFVDPFAAFARPGQNPTYHGGNVIRNARVVLIFWGPSFASGGSDAGYAAAVQSFRNQYGTNPEYNVITQYYGSDPISGYGNIAQSNLATGTADWFDTSTPPKNVTDSTVQSEVLRYLSSHTFDNNTVYEVFIPSASYSSDGTATSCGGPHLTYCAYHGSFSNGGRDIKYAIEPYPSCSGCQASGFSTVQNVEHFICHETREAVTDPDLNAWYDRSGNELDDKCAWSPAPFIVNGFGYQYEWSNSAGGCVKSQ